MDNKEYWKQRECLIEDENFQNTMYHAKKVKEQYEFAKDNIQKEIYKFYKDFAINNKLKLSEAKRILNNNELKEFRTTLKQYEKMIRNDTDGVLKQKILNISIKHRLTRLQALQAKIDIILDNLENEITTEINDNFLEVLENTYYKNIYEIEKFLNLHTDFSMLDVKSIDKILTYNWSGVSYSDRIWRNQSDLKQKLKDSLNKNFIQGTSIAEVSVELSKILESNYKNCVRLVRTEVNYIENKTSIESYKEKDIKQYIFVAVLDLKTSKLCSEMDGEIINVDDLIVGVNCPPLHPYCRSTVIPYIEGLERNRISKDILTGKTEEIGNLNYKEWYKKYVESKYTKEQVENIKKKFLNYSSDKTQYLKYKSVLRDEFPEKFDEFQNLKYNSKEEYDNLKQYYRYKTNYPNSNKNYFEIHKKVKNLISNNIVNENIGTAIKPIKEFIGDINNHALSRMKKRGVTKEMAQSYIDNAIVEFSQNGKNMYLSSDGVSVLLKEDRRLITTYSSKDFDESIFKILEVVDGK